MSVEFAALVFSVLGPIVSGYAVYLSRRSDGHLQRHLSNDMPHLIARLDRLEERVARLADWMRGQRHPP